MATTVASKRLRHESNQIFESQPEGILAGPFNDANMFIWQAYIPGPKETPYEGGVFPAELTFPEDYPLSPPKMKFLGEIWHPNGMVMSSIFRQSHAACST
jgi:ubiquitin-conjugating enzyme E2 G2